MRFSENVKTVVANEDRNNGSRNFIALADILLASLEVLDSTKRCLA